MSFVAPKSLAMGRYEITTSLATDELGEAWAGRDHRSGRPIVVKFLTWGGGRAPPVGRTSFANEARALLERPLEGALSLVSMALEGRVLYLVCDEAELIGLDAAILANGKLEPGDAADVLDAVLATLERAHARGLVLRDLSPRTVLLAPDSTARLSWFGALTPPVHAPELAPIRFRAPEQADALAAMGSGDPGWDVFSAGQLLYAMITGAAPEQALSASAAETALGPALTPIYCAATALGAARSTAAAMRASLAEIRGQLASGDPLAALRAPDEAPVLRPPQPLPARKKAGVALLAVAALVIAVGVSMLLDLRTARPFAPVVAEPQPVGASPTAPAEPAVPSAPADATASGSSKRRAPAPVDGPTGHVQIHTDTPNARIQSQGALLGRTPLEIDLPAGSNRLTLISPAGERATAVLNIDAESQSAFCWSFETDGPCAPSPSATQ